MDDTKSLKRRTRFRIFKSHLGLASFVLATICAVLLWYKKHEYTSVSIRDRGSSQSSFRLTRTYRHGISQDPYMQVLDIDEQVLQAGQERFMEHVSMLSDEEAQDDDMWTSKPEYSTSNPLDFEFRLASEPLRMKRMLHRDPQFVESYLDFSHENPHMAAKVNLEWIDKTVLVPNVSDKQTVISLALMSSDAYVRLPHTGDWRNLTEPWNHTHNSGHGWENDGLRGHLFVNSEQDIVVMAVKGTSARGLAGSGEDETTVNDQINDNLLFSCCCARISYLWTTVCDCYMKSYTCDETCLEQELSRKDRYYKAVLNFYKDVVAEYPNSTIWVTGHSLGGALASLLGRTYGLPVVAFEAPGELLATRRLHLPMPPGYPDYLEGIWHFGNTADPIFMGTCNGASSSCSIAGYAMETSCHTGKVCVYDVVKDKGWHVSMLNHRIHKVIDGVIDSYEGPARCIPPGPCHDCYNWKYVQKGHSSSVSQTRSPKTTSTSTVPPEPTITSSCVGRNWIGICTEYE
ncbi:triglyceride lipase ATG15 [Lachancea thermotolerans CBS 6340]|uniref:Putative lipase ATG15 n=1 Tax=Lachancea thermotolerans (strain ATCC 56472 / CBS 6340 / NRRL Y-8284) TaxID=559295 RepID=C5DBZ6_LACTC|nr:KLTH0A06622p [Lachancea thermotolerans CBS 6340]CAR21303.1 KLTH0A06622p [Lachancea thermotolerans CBS 6340]